MDTGGKEKDTLLTAALHLACIVAGWSVPWYIFGILAYGQWKELPGLWAGMSFCAGGAAACLAVNFRDKAAVKTFILIAAALMPAFGTRVLKAAGLTEYSTGVTILLYCVTAAAGFFFSASVAVLGGKKAVRGFLFSFICGGLLRLAVEKSPFLLPLTEFTSAASVIIAVVLAVLLAREMEEGSTKILTTVAVIAAVTVILFIPATGKPVRERIFTYDGYRFSEPASEQSYIIYTPSGRVSSHTPADAFSFSSFLPATLQTDNHNLQVLLSAPPTSVLAVQAMLLPRIAGLDHISGDPELAAINQAGVITTAAVRRCDRLSQLGGPYDIAAVTDGDPADFVPFLTTNGILAVEGKLAELVAEDTFLYKIQVPGAESFTLFSNAPLTGDWQKMQNRYDAYDGKIKNFPAGILATLYKWNRSETEKEQPQADLAYSSSETLPVMLQKFSLAENILPLILLGGCIILRFISGRYRFAVEMRTLFLRGCAASASVFFAAAALEEAGVPVFFCGYAFFLPFCIPVLFPNGISSGKTVYVLLPFFAAGCILAGAGIFEFMAVGAAAMAACGWRPQKEEYFSAGISGLIFIAGCFAALTGLWLCGGSLTELLFLLAGFVILA